MTPWRCAEEIADFLRDEIARYDEKSGTGEAHAEFLPIADVRRSNVRTSLSVRIR